MQKTLSESFLGPREAKTVLAVSNPCDGSGEDRDDCAVAVPESLYPGDADETADGEDEGVLGRARYRMPPPQTVRRHVRRALLEIMDNHESDGKIRLEAAKTLLGMVGWRGRD